MDDMNRLGDLILKHWRTHRPEVVEELERTNQLQPVLRQAQEQTGDLLYNLTVVQKMEYQAAWELATREWAFLPGEDRPPPPWSPPGRHHPASRTRARPRPVPRFPNNRRAPDRRRQPPRQGFRQYRSHPHTQAHRSRKPRGNRRGKIPAREIHRLGRDGECLPPLPAARMAAYRRRTPRIADGRRIRIRPRLDAQCPLHLARW